MLLLTLTTLLVGIIGVISGWIATFGLIKPANTDASAA
jgi:hypothetical protein